MSGTKQGGKQTALINKIKYGPDFYKKIGSIGGRKGKTGGFATEKLNKNGLTGKEQARISGSLGGKISKRGRYL